MLLRFLSWYATIRSSSFAFLISCSTEEIEMCWNCCFAIIRYILFHLYCIVNNHVHHLWCILTYLDILISSKGDWIVFWSHKIEVLAIETIVLTWSQTFISFHAISPYTNHFLGNPKFIIRTIQSEIKPFSTNDIKI